MGFRADGGAHTPRTCVCFDPDVTRYEKGGCWEITGCSFDNGAGVGTTYGCKGIPPAGWKSPCDANGVWAFNENNTITSVMSGKCLEISASAIV